MGPSRGERVLEKTREDKIIITKNSIRQMRTATIIKLWMIITRSRCSIITAEIGT